MLAQQPKLSLKDEDARLRSFFGAENGGRISFSINCHVEGSHVTLLFISWTLETEKTCSVDFSTSVLCLHCVAPKISTSWVTPIVKWITHLPGSVPHFLH